MHQGLAKEPRWELFPHGSDIGIRGIGPTVSQAFAQVGMAMTGVVTDPKLVRTLECLDIELRSSSLDDLLFDWVDALVYEMATRKMLFSRFEVRIEGHHLVAAIWGEPVDRAVHAPAVEIKGPTFTELEVAEDESHTWVAQCVVDV